MAVPQELEIQDWQRKPGLKNPLTKDQVEWFRQGWGTFCPPSGEEIQNVAEKLLLKGASTDEIINRLADLI